MAFLWLRSRATQKPHKTHSASTRRALCAKRERHGRGACELSLSPVEIRTPTATNPDTKTRRKVFVVMCCCVYKEPGRGAPPRRNNRVVTVLWQFGPWLTVRCDKTGDCFGETPSPDHPRFHVNDCAPPPSSLSPGGVRIAALLLGAIESPHEASSQLARASEVTWKWSVISLLLVFRVRLADPVRA